MDLIADLHLHSRFARGCSSKTNVEMLERFARIKGIDILGTGDFTHPKWFEELNEKLEEDEKGILRTKKGFKFLWSTEISLIYTQGQKGRRVHHVILAPNKDTVKQIQDELLKKGRLDYDGRPIFGFTSIELVDIMRGINPDIEIIPAHAWTSWFAIFGSKSGFNSIQECFGENSKYIHAIETGMSSDPEMNSALSRLDGINLVSFSDAHSFWPWRLGREATIFDVKNPSYSEILKAIRTGKGLKSTIETDPEYGKYHFDGHRRCHVIMDPRETREKGTECPRCGGLITVGVLNRVLALADREIGEKAIERPPYVKVIPLHELISFAIRSGISAKKTWEVYYKLIKRFRTEYNVLLNARYEEIKEESTETVANLVIKSREGGLKIRPGYDGEYGEIQEETPPEEVKEKNQKSLAEF